jgi:membrane protein implicated in regulation of membrane protease activity
MLLVAAVAGGDYLLWTWSSDGGSATIALISGLALAPLILALLWLLSVTVARILFVPRSQRDALVARRRRARRQRVVQRMAGRRAQQATSRRAEESAEQSEMDAGGSPRRTSEKIAA